MQALTSTYGLTTRLNSHGYAIIHNVLTKKQCKRLKQGLWQHTELISRNTIKQNDPTTWKNIFNYYPMHGMIQKHFGYSHIQSVWDVRQSSNVIEPFENIWGTKELCCSFDGIALSLAPEVTGRGWHRKGWLHCDQNPHNSKRECYQSWVTAEDIGEGDATLTVLEGSHLLHRQFNNTYELPQTDFLQLKPEHIEWYLSHGCKERHITCPAGSMVLWDSRTIHAGRGPVKGRANPKNRYVVYVCMTPSSKLTESSLIKKRNALRKRRTSNHCPHKPKLVSKVPRTWGGVVPHIPRIPKPVLTLRGATLAGWIRYPKKCPFVQTKRRQKRRQKRQKKRQKKIQKKIHLFL